MPDTARARTGLRAPDGGTDTLDTYDNTVATAFDLIETDMAIDGQGVLGSRPTSTLGSPGKRGRYYWATDTKQLFRDNGTGWDEIAFAAQQGWQTLTCINGLSVRYYKDTLGFVHMAGNDVAPVTTIPQSSPTTDLGTFPPGYRPGAAGHSGVLVSLQQTPNFIPMLITSTGILRVTDSSGAIVSFSRYSFGMLSWRAEN